MKATAPLQAHLFRAVMIARCGGAEVLDVVDFGSVHTEEPQGGGGEDPSKSSSYQSVLRQIFHAPLQPGEVLVRNSYAGLNFIDTYFRSGLYKKPQGLPFVCGEEGSGTIMGVGEGVDPTRLGQRVAWFGQCTGSYSSFCRLPSSYAFSIPSTAISDESAAAVMLQGCTAHYLTRDCFCVKPGDVVLIHAAAGGTGLLLTQVCKMFGATVIGTCSGGKKESIAKDIGKCDVVIDYVKTPEWDVEVRKAFPQGVNVVYDGVGKATFDKGLKVLRRRGSMISFGNASGAVDPIAPLTLTQHGSLTLQRPTLKDFCSLENGEIQTRVRDVLDWVSTGKVKVLVAKVFPMQKAKEAQEYLQGREAIGKVLLNCLE